VITDDQLDALTLQQLNGRDIDVIQVSAD